MIEESEALERIRAGVPAAVGEICGLTAADGRFLLEDLLATVAMPGFDNSAMDGYAVRVADAGTKGAALRVTGEQPAGQDLVLTVGEGEAVRIFTGAPMPRGADAVVMQEDVEREGDTIRVAVPAEPGEFIRHRGSDLCEGQTILRAGQRIHARAIGLMASQGLCEVCVGRPPSVAVVTTGDELVPPGQALEQGQIYNSNGPMLAAMAAELTGEEPSALLHGIDESEALRRTLREALAAAEFVIISGGVSVGERDLVKEVLAEEGVEAGFWRVRVKPGKPFLFGKSAEGKLVFGLPGNPVSSFVTFQLFVRPAILRSMGAGEEACAQQSVQCRLAEPLRNRGDRPHHVRGTLSDDGAIFTPSRLQQSHALFGLSRSSGLLRMAEGQNLDAGAEVTVRLV